MADNKFRYSHDNCPVCNQLFQSDDDIVVCPVCGTPHHRECYKQTNSCSNADKHSEDFHWEPSAPIEVTPSKEEDKAENVIKGFGKLEIDPQSLPLPFARSLQNPLKNFPPELEEGVSTEDIAAFVQQDSVKYIQKFFYIKNGRKQWNWAALFFAPYWFFYRKLYKHGVIVMAIALCLSFLSFLPPVERFISTMTEYQEEIAILSEEDLTNEEYMTAATELTTKTQNAIRENKLGAGILVLQSLLSIALSVFIGLNANTWYYKRVTKNIKDIHSKESDPEAVKQLIFKTGGLSYGAAFLSVLAEKTVIFGFELIIMMFNH